MMPQLDRIYTFVLTVVVSLLHLARLANIIYLVDHKPIGQTLINALGVIVHSNNQVV